MEQFQQTNSMDPLSGCTTSHAYLHITYYLEFLYLVECDVFEILQKIFIARIYI